jgi:hypothetical protein
MGEKVCCNRRPAIDVLVADGMIVDIGAPAFEMAASDSSSGSSGGGCFIACAF